ncbi:MAG: hypothetical protein K8R85_12070 [Bacteroidetes bacterium]|nr:hypothetical protein [Bacteroidota bacterium]
MALNANHTFEDLGNIKCAIVEKNCSDERVTFLKNILEFNNFTVEISKSPPAKVAAKPPTTEEGVNLIVEPKAPETYTVGVTDLSFNPANAIFNRELKTKEGKIVTPDYWNQLDIISKDDLWYWKKN